MNKAVLQEKVKAVEETVRLLKEYPVVAAADLNKVSASMLQDVRKKLRGRLLFKVVKRSIMAKSLEAAGKEGWEEFNERIAGPNIFLFTSGNPYKVAMELEASKVKVFARPGELAQQDIVLPAGNTGLSPGPLIGLFGVLGVRTRIEGGNIWVTQDTLVCRKGEPISEELAEILQRMGIRASEMGLKIKAAYDNGVTIPGEELVLDLGEYRSRLEQAYQWAFRVAVEAAYPAPTTVPVILARLRQRALAVAVEAGWPTVETVPLLVAKAAAQARSLAMKVGQHQAED